MGLKGQLHFELTPRKEKLGMVKKAIFCERVTWASHPVRKTWERVVCTKYAGGGTHRVDVGEKKRIVPWSRGQAVSNGFWSAKQVQKEGWSSIKKILRGRNPGARPFGRREDPSYFSGEAGWERLGHVRRTAKWRKEDKGCHMVLQGPRKETEG